MHFSEDMYHMSAYLKEFSSTLILERVTYSKIFMFSSGVMGELLIISLVHLYTSKFFFFLSLLLFAKKLQKLRKNYIILKHIFKFSGQLLEHFETMNKYVELIVLKYLA